MKTYVCVKDQFGDVCATELPENEEHTAELIVGLAANFVENLGWFDDGEEYDIGICEALDAGAARIDPMIVWRWKSKWTVPEEENDDD